MMSIQVQPLPSINIPNGGLNMQVLRRQPQKEKVLVVMGATGTGKSRLSIDIATRFPAEIINSDKIQVYEGLDIATNKITEEEQCGIPHHLLGIIQDPASDFTAPAFCNMASLSTRSIVGRGQLPIIVGGSNSYIEALVDDENHEFRSRYECCFLWVDVSLPELHSFVSNRVNRMVAAGMVEEVRNMFDPDADHSRGIRRAIGVPELDRYFKMEPSLDKESRSRLLQEVIDEIKDNTFKLACRQLGKIHRLRNVKGWKLHRLNATEVFRKSGREADEAWEREVAGPSSKIVRRFLYSRGAPDQVYRNARAAAAAMGAAVAAASH
ncbi:adenylate isopentenyltransferase 3, chloroplastic [Diospyros lotus]|uniref:adenylate isopentenyltransferase 3, chloroplastic n=1 Tax=Diospyros lotus TaxID=55363 RepID=UPI002252DE28|nr:adenylate isopentenyltransferase 3, chloroplastic [Diospyros lotus]